MNKWMWIIIFFIVQAFGDARAEIVITTPSDNNYVEERPIVRGTINPSAPVWVIVHPVKTSNYWVQPISTVNGTNWSAQIYIGRPGSIDVGKHFEIKAFSVANNNLTEGVVLGRWPDAKDNSQVIEVIRGK